MDNYYTHKSVEVQRWLKPKRWTASISFTPTSSSWLNQVERFLALITERMIRRGTFDNATELEQAIYKWLAYAIRLERLGGRHPRQGPPL